MASLAREELMPPRFFADDMVGKLARWLRLSGFDCAYQRSIPDEILAQHAAREERVVLTRDTHLAKRFPGLRVELLTSDNPIEQLRQVKETFALDLRAGLFTRCLECNSEIEQAPKESLMGKVPPYVYETQQEFFRCPGCDRLYWVGSHHQRMCERLEQWLARWENSEVK